MLMTGRTRLLVVTHVSNVLGTINPVKNIIELAHQNGTRVLVDGAQAVMHQAVDVQEIDCDFYVFSGHKLYTRQGLGCYTRRKSCLILCLRGKVAAR